MTNYGAVDSKDTEAASAVDSSFEEYNVDYLGAQTLSPNERFKKIVSASLPLVIAVLLMVGFGFLSSSALHYHNPQDYSSPISVSSAEPNSSSSSYSSSSKVVPSIPPKKANSSSSSASCSENPACLELGLIGNCCPTDTGVTLGCC